MPIPSSLPSTLETFLMHGPVSPMCDSSSAPLMELAKVSQIIVPEKGVEPDSDTANLDNSSPQLLEVRYVHDQLPNKNR